MVDDLVLLAEAWDSGASGWDAARRKTYANYLDASERLIAVTNGLVEDHGRGVAGLGSVAGPGEDRRLVRAKDPR